MGLARPKKPGWLYASLAIGVVSLVAYLLLSTWRPWDPGRRAGLVFGILASLIFLLEALYPLRRPLLGFPFRSAQNWIQFHIFGGILAFLFVLIHEDLRWPSGTMGWLLLLLSFWTTLSGLVGVWLQKWIPALLASGLSVEALFERIPELVERLQTEADKLVEGSSEILDRFYRDSVRPVLTGIETSWSYLLDVRSGRDLRLAPFTRMSPFLEEAERARLEDLKAILIEKLELDAQFSLQRILRGWVVIHLPPALVLLGLTIFHVWTNLTYQ